MDSSERRNIFIDVQCLKGTNQTVELMFITQATATRGQPRHFL